MKRAELRINDPQILDCSAIRSEVSNGGSVIVQYSRPLYTDAALAALNTLCAELDDKLCVRFYAHYFAKFDCATLRHLPAVKNLELNCLMEVDNFDSLKELHYLSRLNIEIAELTDADFLSWSNLNTVTDFRLGGSRKNNVELKYLEDYTGITTLSLDGHIKNIQAIGKLEKITELTLSISSRASIGCLNHLPKLKTLRFVLGGRTDLNELDLFTAETLEIVRVKGFTDLGNLSKFKNLKKLLIRDQIQIRRLDFGGDLTNLTDVQLFNCKNLGTVAGLSHLRSLRTFRVYKTSIDFDDMMQQKLPAALKTLAFNTSIKSIDTAIKARLTSLGYDDVLPQG